MPMEQRMYDIKFAKAISVAEQLKKVNLSLEECSAKFSTLSREMQKGLESDARRLKSNSEATGSRADEMRSASGALITITEGYREAEELASNKIADAERATDFGGTMGTGGGGGFGGGSYGGDDKAGYGDQGSSVDGDSGATGTGSGDYNGMWGADGWRGEGDGSNEHWRGSDYTNLEGSDYLDSETQNPFFPPGFDFWNSTQEERIHWWESLPEGLQWLFISPAILALMQATGNSPRDVWNFIRGLINNRRGRDRQGANATGEDDEDGEDGGDGAAGDVGDCDGDDSHDSCTGAHVGSAVIDYPEDDFQDSIECVCAQTGSATIADDQIGTGGYTAVLGDSIVVGDAGVDTGSEAWAETGAATGVATGAATGAAIGGLAGAAAGFATGYDTGLDAGFDSGLDTELDLGLDAGLGGGLDSELDLGLDSGLSSGFDTGLDTGLDIDAEEMEAVAADASGGGELPIADGVSSDGGMAAGDGPSKGGLAAPLIGAGSALSMAAAGIGIGNVGGKGNNDMGPAEQIPLIVKAKQSSGLFAGELIGEYVLIATACSMVFSGLSLGAAVSRKKDKKPDDRFRTGYGVSAVLSGGPIQERA